MQQLAPESKSIFSMAGVLGVVAESGGVNCSRETAFREIGTDEHETASW